MDNRSLIEKAAAHSRIWCAAAVLAALVCIVSGALGLLIRTEVPIGEIADAPHYGHVRFKADGRDEDADFELRNTFCRYIPTGKEYYYRVQTSDGGRIFVRAAKDFAEDMPEEIEGRAAAFGGHEKTQLREVLALNDEYFVDALADRLYGLRIAAGALLLAETALGALMIKKKIPDGGAYKIANIVFSTLPIAVLALGIHLMGYF